MARRRHSNEDFGDVVKRARLRAGLSQSEVARRAGLTQGFLSRVEADDAEPPSQRVVVLLADAIGMPRLRLFLAAGLIPEDVEAAFFETPELFQMIANLKRKQRDAIYKQLKADYPDDIDPDAEDYRAWLRALMRRVANP